MSNPDPAPLDVACFHITIKGKGKTTEKHNLFFNLLDLVCVLSRILLLPSHYRLPLFAFV